MARRIPSYRFHKASRQAIVVLGGHTHYLGKWNSPESRDEYDRIMSEWFAAGRSKAVPPPSATEYRATVGEVLLAYWRHAEGYYRDREGRPTGELDNVRDALRPLRRLYGRTQAVEFGPLALRAVRDEMVRAGLARGTINARVHRAFRWAASVQLIPGSVVVDLDTVEALAEGRTEARETEPVKPVPLETVEATLPFLSPTVAAMVRVQLLSGCRPSEVMTMRGCDLKMGEEGWEYRPASHKNAWRKRGRVVTLGPRAVEVVREFLKPDLSAYLFDPREAVARHHEGRRSRRTSKPTPSELKRRSKGTPGAKLKARYDRRSYRQAVARACDRAFPHPVEVELTARLDNAPKGQRRTVQRELAAWRREHRDELAAWRTSHRWCPLQLRHTAATAVRARYGLEGAQVVLGHASADTTQIYAEASLEKARSIVAEIG